MKLLIFTFIALSMPFLVCSQNGISTVAGARGAGMANASVAFTDIHSIFSNQAGLAYLSQFAAVAMGEQRFLTNIKSMEAGVALPTNSGTLGLTVQYFGNSGYSEKKVGLAYGRKLTESLSLGAQIDYLQTTIPEYANNNAFSFELGLHSSVTSNFRVAAHVSHPIQIKLSETENLPTLLKVGCAYLPSKNITLNAEVEKDIDRKLALKTGFEYGFSELLFVRAGVRTEPVQLSFGVGVKTKGGLTADFAASYHPILGITPSVGIVYSKTKN